jgi:hypothetical protein
VSGQLSYGSSRLVAEGNMTLRQWIKNGAVLTAFGLALYAVSVLILDGHIC